MMSRSNIDNSYGPTMETMTHMEEKFQQFLEFCRSNSSNPGILKLIAKRYGEADTSYKESQEFLDLIENTKSQLRVDGARFFVHLRDFLAILKDKKEKVERTSEFSDSDESQTEETNELNSDSKRKKRAESDSDSSSKQCSKRQRVCFQSDSEDDQESYVKENEKDDIANKDEDNNDVIEESELEGNEQDISGTTEKAFYDADFEPSLPSLKTKSQEPHEQADEGESEYLDTIESGQPLDDSEKDKIDCVEVLSSVKTTHKQNDRDLDSGKDLDISDEDTKSQAITKHNDSGENEIEMETSKDEQDHIKTSQDVVNESQESVYIIDNTPPKKTGEFTNKKPSQEPKQDVMDCSIEILSDVDGDIIVEKNSEDKEKNEMTCTNKQELNDEIAILDSDDHIEDQETDGNADKTAKKSLKYDDTSSDDSDPDYAKKAKKFREKCKKKYKVSVGKKKNVLLFTPVKNDEKKINLKSPRRSYGMSLEFRKDNENYTPKRKKKSSPRKDKSPKKSPKQNDFIILTENESSDDEIMCVEDLKKKIQKKEDDFLKDKFNIDDDPFIMVEKIPVKFEHSDIDMNKDLDTADFDDYTNELDDYSEKRAKASDLDKNDERVVTSETDCVNQKQECADDDKKDIDDTHKKSDEVYSHVLTELKNKIEKPAEKKRAKLITLDTSDGYNKKFINEDDVKMDEVAGEIANEPDTSVHKGKTKSPLFSKHSSSDQSKKHVKHSSDKHNSPDALHKKKEERSDTDKTKSPRPGTSTETTEEGPKKGSTKQIRRLEALLEQIRDQIEKVRSRELDLEDLDSDISDYILEDKLQRKFVKVYQKLCELHKAESYTGRPTEKYFRYQGTRYEAVNRKIERFINKKKVFPDYHDIRGLIVKVNKAKRLNLRLRDIDDLAREAFTDVGNQLQKRRQKDFISNFHFQGSEVNAFSVYDDPALIDTDLKKKLDHNKKEAKSKMDQVVEKYASLQYEVGDKTDNEGEDDDEDNADEADEDPLAGVDDLDEFDEAVDNVLETNRHEGKHSSENNISGFNKDGRKFGGGAAYTGEINDSGSSKSPAFAGWQTSSSDASRESGEIIVGSGNMLGCSPCIEIETNKSSENVESGERKRFMSPGTSLADEQCKEIPFNEVLGLKRKDVSSDTVADNIEQKKQKLSDAINLNDEEKPHTEDTLGKSDSSPVVILSEDVDCEMIDEETMETEGMENSMVSEDGVENCLVRGDETVDSAVRGDKNPENAFETEAKLNSSATMDIENSDESKVEKAKSDIECLTPERKSGVEKTTKIDACKQVSTPENKKGTTEHRSAEKGKVKTKDQVVKLAHSRVHTIMVTILSDDDEDDDEEMRTDISSEKGGMKPSDQQKNSEEGGSYSEKVQKEEQTDHLHEQTRGTKEVKFSGINDEDQPQGYIKGLGEELGEDVIDIQSDDDDDDVIVFDSSISANMKSSLSGNAHINVSPKINTSNKALNVNNQQIKTSPIMPFQSFMCSQAETNLTRSSHAPVKTSPTQSFKTGSSEKARGEKLQTSPGSTASSGSPTKGTSKVSPPKNACSPKFSWNTTIVTPTYPHEKKNIEPSKRVSQSMLGGNFQELVTKLNNLNKLKKTLTEKGLQNQSGNIKKQTTDISPPLQRYVKQHHPEGRRSNLPQFKSQKCLSTESKTIIPSTFHPTQVQILKVRTVKSGSGTGSFSKGFKETKHRGIEDPRKKKSHTHADSADLIVIDNACSKKSSHKQQRQLKRSDSDVIIIEPNEDDIKAKNQGKSDKISGLLDVKIEKIEGNYGAQFSVKSKNSEPPSSNETVGNKCAVEISETCIQQCNSYSLESVSDIFNDITSSDENDVENFSPNVKEMQDSVQNNITVDKSKNNSVNKGNKQDKCNITRELTEVDIQLDKERKPIKPNIIDAEEKSEKKHDSEEEISSTVSDDSQVRMVKLNIPANNEKNDKLVTTQDRKEGRASGPKILKPSFTPKICKSEQLWSDDENAGLIESYQEPDSTGPVIVLSDSE
ncbi:kinesin-related protein 4-like isoform X2 [Mya arenaria]|uniref:kinesin-related protein 4-like isoform X2 n=1 Tax=Mya arenaria TaxID=6604 RepID=UPI0022E7EC8D|nr:kinesin-related protein 4-like isoform X2 [Mya arenaria]